MSTPMGSPQARRLPSAVKKGWRHVERKVLRERRQDDGMGSYHEERDEDGDDGQDGEEAKGDLRLCGCT